MNEYNVFNNDFQVIGKIQALSPSDALEKAKSNPKIKRQCLNPMVEEKVLPQQNVHTWMRRQ